MPILNRYPGQVIENVYGAGPGIVWLDNIQCNGDETCLASCSNSGWGNTGCSSSQSVAISCRKYLQLIEVLELLHAKFTLSCKFHADLRNSY